MKQILVVDDERDIVELLRAKLAASGYKTLAAYEGIRAIEVAHKQKPDLILLDLRMPAGTGQTVLQTLRSRQETKDIPVIVLTASTEPNLKERVLAAGAQDFMEKPYDDDDLLRRIRSVLKEP